MIGCKRVSADNDLQLQHLLCDEEQLTSWSESQYVADIIADKIYIAWTTDANDDDQELELVVLHPPLPSTEFHWPEDMSTHVAPYPHVLSYVDITQMEDKFILPANDVSKQKQQAALRKKKIINMNKN